MTHWPFLLLIPQETWYWQENINANQVVMSGVKCSGTELSLAHCRQDEDVACPQGGAHYGAGVACSESEFLGVGCILPARLQERTRVSMVIPRKALGPLPLAEEKRNTEVNSC